MGKKENEKRVSMYEQVAEARVKQIVEEQEELIVKDPTVAALENRTKHNLMLMAEAKEEGNEEKRREIRNDVVVDNMRLVTHVLKKYGYFSPDKFQNGCIGLLKAADTYNIEREVPFRNYAAFCIESEVRLAFKRTNRMFESKNKGYLDSLDAPSTMDNGDSVDRYEMIEDPFAEQEIDALVEEAGIDELFYNIIIPAIQEYGSRGKDMDMEAWQTLTIQYFIGLSMEQSQRQRLTFTEMANQLGSTPQNLRIRHKKVMELVRKKCEDHGWTVYKSETGRSRFALEEREVEVKGNRGAKHKKR